MTPIQALQDILAKIQDTESAETLADLVGEIKTTAKRALDDCPIPNQGTIFSFNGFKNSRRSMDAVLKGAILAAGGQVQLVEEEIERYRVGYDLHIEGRKNGIILRAIEAR